MMMFKIGVHDVQMSSTLENLKVNYVKLKFILRDIFQFVVHSYLLFIYIITPLYLSMNL